MRKNAHSRSYVLKSASNVSWTSLKCIFCYFSQSSAPFKSQLLTLIRIELSNINFNVSFNNCGIVYSKFPEYECN